MTLEDIPVLQELIPVLTISFQNTIFGSLAYKSRAVFLVAVQIFIGTVYGEYNIDNSILRGGDRF